MAVYQLNSANFVDIKFYCFSNKKQDDTVHQKSSINLIIPFFKDYIQSKCCSIPPLQDALSQYRWMNYLKIIRAATLTFILAAWLDWNTHHVKSALKIIFLELLPNFHTIWMPTYIGYWLSYERRAANVNGDSSCGNMWVLFQRVPHEFDVFTHSSLISPYCNLNLFRSYSITFLQIIVLLGACRSGNCCMNEGFLYRMRDSCTAWGFLVPHEGFLYRMRASCTAWGLLAPHEGFLYRMRDSCTAWGFLVPHEGFLYRMRASCTAWGLLAPHEGFLYRMRASCTAWGLLVPHEGFLYRMRASCTASCTAWGLLVPHEGFLYRMRVSCTAWGLLVPHEGFLYRMRVSCTTWGLLVPLLVPHGGFLYRMRASCTAKASCTAWGLLVSYYFVSTNTRCPVVDCPMLKGCFMRKRIINNGLFKTKALTWKIISSVS